MSLRGATIRRGIEKRLYELLVKTPNPKPVVVLGPHRCGKSMSITAFIRGKFKFPIFVNVDDSGWRGIFLDDTIVEANLKIMIAEAKFIHGVTENVNPADCILFFDEIERCPNINKVLETLSKHYAEYKVVCAGVYTNNFVADSATVINMRLMSFREFLTTWQKAIGEWNGLGGIIVVEERVRKNAVGERIVELIPHIEKMFSPEELLACYGTNTPLPEGRHAIYMDLLQEYILIGGIPMASVGEIVGLRNKYFDNFFHDKETIGVMQELHTAIKKEVIKSCESRPKAIEVWHNIILQLQKGNRKFQYSLIKEGAREKEYADEIAWLKKMKFIIRVPRMYDDKAFKLYYNDIGMLSAQCCEDEFEDIRQEQLENYIAQELTAKGIKPFYWESGEKAEVEFVFGGEEGLTAIKAKANGVASKDKNLVSFEKAHFGKVKQKIMVTATGNFGYENGIKYVPPYAVWCIK